MSIPNPIQRDFDNSSQRIVANVHAMRAEYMPVKSESASEESQKQLYDFLTDVYEAIYENPMLIQMDTEPDEVEEKPHAGRPPYEPWHHRHLPVRKHMRKNLKIFCDFFEALQSIGEISTLSDGKLSAEKSVLKFNKPKLKKICTMLSHCGVGYSDDNEYLTIWHDKYPFMCPAWKLLSEIHSANPKRDIFIRSLFDVESESPWAILYKLSDKKEMLKNLVDDLTEKEFSVSGHISSHGMEMRIRKNYYEPMQKESLSVGFSCGFNFGRYNQMGYDFLRGKTAFKYLTTIFNDLPENLQNLVFRFTGKCNACGFCCSMNKEAAMKREKPFAYTTRVYKGKEVNLCHSLKSMESSGGYENKTNYVLDEELLRDICNLFNYINENLPLENDCLTS